MFLGYRRREHPADTSQRDHRRDNATTDPRAVSSSGAASRACVVAHLELSYCFDSLAEPVRLARGPPDVELMLDPDEIAESAAALVTGADDGSERPDRLFENREPLIQQVV